MPSLSPRSPCISFGPFEMDVAVGELRKAGILVKLQPQPFQVLLLLAEHAGALVTREEIQRCLWSDSTFVDFEHGINFSINQIRGALADNAEKPRYIETLPRRGYRFIAPVNTASKRDSPAEMELPAGAAPTTKLRYRSASDMRADLQRLKHDSGRTPMHAPEEKTLVVLYFENLSRDAEDEYLRDGMTEDVITELSKIKKLRVFPRAAVFLYRNRVITAPQVGQELNATYVLGGTIRRAGNPCKPTEDLQAYDYYLRGRSFARRETRADLELAIQMYEHAIMLDRHFALAKAGVAAACAKIYEWHEHDSIRLERGLANCAVALTFEPELAEALAARALLAYVQKLHDEAIHYACRAIERKANCEGAYFVLGGALFASDRWTEGAALVKRAVEANGDDYNVYTPFMNIVRSLGSVEAAQSLREQEMRVLEHHLQLAPEDARARILLSGDYAYLGRKEAAVLQLHQAMAIRPHDSNILYNAACTYGLIGEKEDALAMLKSAKEYGYTNWGWVSRDPDLACLHDDPGFRLLVKGVH